MNTDLFEISSVDSYTEKGLDHNSDESRTSVERNDPNRSIALVQTVPDGFDAYDTVFVGYPIWWGDASWVVDGFVAGNDFAGKAVIPFCTSGSSSIGSSGQNLAALVGSGEWLEGERFSGSTAAGDIEA